MIIIDRNSVGYHETKGPLHYFCHAGWVVLIDPKTLRVVSEWMTMDEAKKELDKAETRK